jgi:hypothetical protein
VAAHATERERTTLASRRVPLWKLHV